MKEQFSFQFFYRLKQKLETFPFLYSSVTSTVAVSQYVAVVVPKDFVTPEEIAPCRTRSTSFVQILMKYMKSMLPLHWTARPAELTAPNTRLLE